MISDRDDPVTDVRRLVGNLNVNKIVPSIDLEKRKIAARSVPTTLSCGFPSSSRTRRRRFPLPRGHL
jgi:hypothetical protein